MQKSSPLIIRIISEKNNPDLLIKNGKVIYLSRVIKELTEFIKTIEHEIHAGSIKLAGAQSLQHVSNVTEDSLEDSELLQHKSTTMKIIIEDGCLVVPQDS